MSVDNLLGKTIQDILVGNDGVDLVIDGKALELYCLDDNASPSKWIMKIDGEPVIVSGDVLDKILLTRLLDKKIKTISIDGDKIVARIGEYEVEIKCNREWAWILDNK